MNETWKEIDGSPGYFISSHGNMTNKRGLACKQITRKGYVKYFVFKSGKQKGCFAHRLVAIAFLPNPENYPQVNHKNGIKTDNRVENLEWCNNSQNVRHGIAIGLIPKPIGENHPQSRLTNQQVREIRALGAYWTGFSRAVTGPIYGVSPAQIKDIRMRRSWSHI